MNENKVSTPHSLNNFFYSHLSKMNKSSVCPLPEEFVFYTSLVLERYAKSDQYFKKTDEGSVRLKVLGTKLLETINSDGPKKITTLKDIGDSILVQLGFFSNSVNKRLNNESYYIGIAKCAYTQLDSLDMKFYDIPHFYRLFGGSIENTISLLSFMQDSFDNFQEKKYLLELKVPNKKIC